MNIIKKNEILSDFKKKEILKMDLKEKNDINRPCLYCFQIGGRRSDNPYKRFCSPLCCITGENPNKLIFYICDNYIPMVKRFLPYFDINEPSIYDFMPLYYAIKNNYNNKDYKDMIVFLKNKNAKLNIRSKDNLIYISIINEKNGYKIKNINELTGIEIINEQTHICSYEKCNVSGSELFIENHIKTHRPIKY